MEFNETNTVHLNVNKLISFEAVERQSINFVTKDSNTKLLQYNMKPVVRIYENTANFLTGLKATGTIYMNH